uniref:Uncharacterized protein n=1 Tax=Brassica oleracea TaxID=3712 RepID=A0A3P6E549_BRAOL|nr:unnamed protein product [Brassica oleracea]
MTFSRIPHSLIKNHNLVCPFSTDKRYATTQVKAPPQLQKTVHVRDIWVFEKSLFHTGACWRLYGHIKFPSKDIIQPAL